LGVREDLHLEAKQPKPYNNLESPDERFELLKDTVAFANAEGGYMIFGLDTPHTNPKIPHVPHDIVSKIITTKKDDAYNPRLVLGLLTTLIFPKLQNIEITWYPSKSDKNMGVTSLYIPNQREIDKIFLIDLKQIYPTLSEGCYSFWKRKDDKPDWLNREEVHKITMQTKGNTHEMIEAMSLQIQSNTTELVQMKKEFSKINVQVKDVVNKDKDNLFSQRIRDLIDEQ
jgi:hypothetical protein